MISAWDIPDSELEWTAIRAGGPGGQHANRAAGVKIRRVPIGYRGVRDSDLHLIRIGPNWYRYGVLFPRNTLAKCW